MRDEHGLAFEVADYSVYFAEIWGCPPDVSNERVHAFFQSEHFGSGVAQAAEQHRRSSLSVSHQHHLGEIDCPPSDN